MKHVNPSPCFMCRNGKWGGTAWGKFYSRWSLSLSGDFLCWESNKSNFSVIIIPERLICDLLPAFSSFFYKSFLSVKTTCTLKVALKKYFSETHYTWNAMIQYVSIICEKAHQVCIRHIGVLFCKFWLIKNCVCWILYISLNSFSWWLSTLPSAAIMSQPFPKIFSFFLGYVAHGFRSKYIDTSIEIVPTLLLNLNTSSDTVFDNQMALKSNSRVF